MVFEARSSDDKFNILAITRSPLERKTPKERNLPG
jgi:hypothetical protein